MLSGLLRFIWKQTPNLSHHVHSMIQLCCSFGLEFFSKLEVKCTWKADGSVKPLLCLASYITRNASGFAAYAQCAGCFHCRWAFDFLCTMMSWGKIWVRWVLQLFIRWFWDLSHVLLIFLVNCDIIIITYNFDAIE